MTETHPTPQMDRQAPRRGRWWLLLLILPYVGLCFPQIYARSAPALFGFPFFYWYQFAWVLVTSGLLAAVYLLEGRRQALSHPADIKEANGTL